MKTKAIQDMTIEELLAAGYTEEAEAWRQKHERKARTRQLVKDGIRSPESMFLIPREVAKASKVKHRGFKD
ncbi:hypothetical protein SAMN05192566_1529 [Methylophilus rhizosphaerae]|uniref:Uncharacterized protein n=1 Tax=Methylophilus rhizosphaerae TaxID=492660 RepID=A0A1G9CM80_9PROT|nr:hypothetical protein [Methylophilus rhizosphaerae]SDK52732.1 hypothetical protein SAMN05192566_1529 [Methylophilus rhizosphaerae]